MSAPVTAEELDEASRIEWMGEILPASRAVDLMHRLASDLAAERAEIQAIATMLDEAGIGHHEGDTVRSRLARMIFDANTEAQRTLAAEAERDAIADRNLDLGRELEALRAAVRAHEERRRAGWPTPNPWNQADLDLWAAGKA